MSNDEMRVILERTLLMAVSESDAAWILASVEGKLRNEFAAQQSVHPTLLTLCPECGVEQIVTHLPTCAHYVAQSG